jgi:predicted RNA-binding Zn ribbon-like protein
MEHIQTRLDHENEFIAGAPALDFANTVGGTRQRITHDHLLRYADLVSFALQAGYISDALASKLLAHAKDQPIAAADVLRRALRLREAIWNVFAPDSETKRAVIDEVAIISNEAANAAGHLRLRRVGDTFSQLWDDEVVLERALWPMAHSAAEILTSEVHRSAVRECESETCSWLFLDQTRNHSRRWCDMRDCGNRAKARRLRERRVAEKKRAYRAASRT